MNTRGMRARLLGVVVFSLGTLLLPDPIRAQVAGSELSGTVTDASGNTGSGSRGESYRWFVSQNDYKPA